MFPSAVWRPLAASFSIAVIIVYSWLGGPAGFQAAEWSSQKVFPQQNTLQPVPENIWQINFDHPEWKDERLQKSVRSWSAKNPSYQHVILDEEAARQFVQRHYSHDSYIPNTYLELGSTILRADYLRYLVLAAEGGIYSDLDTDAIQPIDSWFSDHSDKQTRAIVGLEFEILQRTDLPPGIFLPLQFCQWSLASSAHHPLMDRMVQAVTRELHDLAIAEGVSLSELHPRSDQDVLFTSGPVKWSQEVFAYLSFSTGTEVTHRNFTGLTEPTLVGDVMILPIKAFATGMVGSGGGSEISDETLLRHRFRGSWKMRGGEMPEERKKGTEGQERRKGIEGEGRRKGSKGEERKGKKGEGIRKGNKGEERRKGNEREGRRKGNERIGNTREGKKEE